MRKSNAIGYKLKNGRIKVKTFDFYELEQVLKNHQITIKEISAKEPIWFTSFRKENDKRWNNIEFDIKELRSDVSVLKQDVAAIKNTPTMKRELNLK